MQVKPLNMVWVDNTAVGRIEVSTPIAEMIGSTTDFEEGGDTYRLVGVYYDPAKKQAVTAKDVATEDLVLYFFMQTVAAGGN